MPVWLTTKTILGNKKGLTLVELLVVIVILGILTTLGTVSVLSLVEKSKEKVFEEEAMALITAARTKSAETIVPYEGLCYSIEDLDPYIEKDLTGYSGSVYVSGDNNYSIWVAKNPYIINSGTPGDMNAIKPAVFTTASESCPVSFLTITINTNQGTYSGSIPSAVYEGQQITLNTPTKAGYVFTGWSVVGEGSSINNNVLTVGSEDLVVSANWTANSYTLTINVNGGTWSGTTPQTIAYGNSVTINNPIKANYTFTSWTVNGIGSSISGTTFTMGAEDAILTANWMANSYTLAVNANGGTWSDTTPQTIAYGNSVNIVNPTRVNYTFTGWTVSGAESSISGTTFTMGTEDATLTANWTANSYTLTISANGGTWSGTTPQTIAYGSSVTINNPTRTSYIFDGWTVSGAGSGMAGTTFTMGTENAAITANWIFGNAEFAYTGGAQTYTVPATGYYKLEVWGGQGGYALSTTYNGGYGGYSSGQIYLTKNAILYVYVGGAGTNGTVKTDTAMNGGYNGGGQGYAWTDKYTAGGGGATHIATSSGLLATLSANQSAILIVGSGGGGGAYGDSTCYASNGYGGGINGVAAVGVSKYVTSTGGTQSGGGGGYYTGSFGIGAGCTSGIGGCSGAGGGFYGGGSGRYCGGSSGGSGYIGNANLTNKYMYCYNCTTSSDASTLTYSTTNVSSTATSNYAKSGNGYAKITYISS